MGSLRAWLHLVTILPLGLAILGFWTVLPALSKEAEAKKPWTGTLSDGRKITEDDLNKILQQNALWLGSGRKEGKKADLRMADLRSANLRKAYLWTLTKADLSGANLREAKLIRSGLSEVNLSMADLGLANLTKANLSGAKLDGGVWFEPQPGSLPDTPNLLGIRGLSTLEFKGSSHALVELREAYKKAGLRDEERQVTFALNHTRRLHSWERGGVMGKVESLFNLVFFEWTCQYGMNLGRPLKILALGLLVFTLPYMLALRSSNRGSGIWVVPMSDWVPGRDSKTQPYKLTPRTLFRPLPEGWWARFWARAWRVLRVLRLAFYFSLLSAFSLGWRELNVGNWISRIQKEYALRGKGSGPAPVVRLPYKNAVFRTTPWSLYCLGEFSRKYRFHPGIKRHGIDPGG